MPNYIKTSTQSVTSGSDKTVDELRSVSDVACPVERKAKLDLWIAKYLKIVTCSQLTVGNMKLNSENHDFICEKVAHDCIDELMHSQIFDFDVKDHEYKAEIMVVRRNYEKIEEN